MVHPPVHDQPWRFDISELLSWVMYATCLDNKDTGKCEEEKISNTRKRYLMRRGKDNKDRKIICHISFTPGAFLIAKLKNDRENN